MIKLVLKQVGSSQEKLNANLQVIVDNQVTAGANLKIAQDNMINQCRCN